MHYIVSDIHNDSERLKNLLKRINFSRDDKLYVLGDLFDRTDYAPDPIGVYFTLLGLGERCVVIRGNHDDALAGYILKYYEIPERKRKKAEPYPYNSFRLLSERLTLVDMQNLAEWILHSPLQVECEMGDKKYLLAHAMTSHPNEKKEDIYYLEGEFDDEDFFLNGVEGYISVCGHCCTADNRIWKNARENVYRIDCGCGFKSGKLGCLCIETGEEIYI